MISIYANEYHGWLTYQRDKDKYPTSWGRFATGTGAGGPSIQVNTERILKYQYVAMRQMKLSDAAERKFLNYITAEKKDKTWEFWDNCVHFAKDGWTVATGEQFKNHWGFERPSTLIGDIRSLNSSRSESNRPVSLSSVASAKGYDTVTLNNNGTITGTFTPIGTRISTSITCDPDGKCK